MIIPHSILFLQCCQATNIGRSMFLRHKNIFWIKVVQLAPFWDATWKGGNLFVQNSHWTSFDNLWQDREHTFWRWWHKNIHSRVTSIHRKNAFWLAKTSHMTCNILEESFFQSRVPSYSSLRYVYDGQTVICWKLNSHHLAKQIS